MCKYFCKIKMTCIFCSAIFPFSGFFCAVHLTDGTKTYRPESQIVLEAGTALAFFGGDRSRSVDRVRSELVALCNEWNADNKDKVNVKMSE